MADTRWEDIFEKLQEHGIDVVASTEISSSQDLYDLMCYVPKDNYSTLEPFVDRVETIMDELFPMIRPMHFRTSSFYDDSVKAHMISTQYVNWKKNKRR